MMRWALAGISFLVTVAFIPTIYNAATAPRYAVLSIGIPLLLMAKEVRPTSAHLFGAVLLAYCVASLWWSPISTESAFGLWWMALLAGAFCLGAAEEDLTPCYIAISLGLTVSMIAVVGQKIGVWKYPEAGTPSGLFMNRNYLGEISGVILVALCMNRKWVWTLIPALLVGITASKGVIVALAATGALWGWKRSKAMSIIAVGIGCIIVFGIIPNWGSFSIRIDLWSDTLRGMTWFGKGIGSFFVSFPAHAKDIAVYVKRPEYAHNEFIHFAYELGFGSVFLWAVVALALQGKNEAEKLVLASILFMGLFSFPLHFPTTGFVAALVAGNLCRHRPTVRLDLASRGVHILRWLGERTVSQGHLRQDRTSGKDVPAGSRDAARGGYPGHKVLAENAEGRGS